MTGFNVQTKCIMNRYNEVKQIVEKLEQDFDKFYNDGNKAAGTRVRKGMQELVVAAKDIRKEIQAKKNKNSQA